MEDQVLTAALVHQMHVLGWALAIGLVVAMMAPTIVSTIVTNRGLKKAQDSYRRAKMTYR